MEKKRGIKQYRLFECRLVGLSHPSDLFQLKPELILKTQKIKITLYARYEKQRNCLTYNFPSLKQRVGPKQ